MTLRIFLAVWATVIAIPHPPRMRDMSYQTFCNWTGLAQYGWVTITSLALLGIGIWIGRRHAQARGPEGRSRGPVSRPGVDPNRPPP